MINPCEPSAPQLARCAWAPLAHVLESALDKRHGSPLVFQYARAACRSATQPWSLGATTLWLQRRATVHPVGAAPCRTRSQCSRAPSFCWSLSNPSLHCPCVRMPRQHTLSSPPARARKAWQAAQQYTCAAASPATSRAGACGPRLPAPSAALPPSPPSRTPRP